MVQFDLARTYGSKEHACLVVRKIVVWIGVYSRHRNIGNTGHTGVGLRERLVSLDLSFL